MPDIGVIILAGGSGSRIGGRKPDRLFRGRRLIAPVLDRVIEWGAPAAACVRAHDQVSGTGLDCIIDRPGIAGPLAGLLAGFSWAAECELRHILTVPCDTPFLPGDLLSKLRRAAIEAGAPAVACCDGRRHPTCTVWPAETGPRVEAYAATGRRSLSGALEWCGAVDAKWTLDAGPLFININTPADLKRWS